VSRQELCGWSDKALRHWMVSLDGQRVPLSAEERGARQGIYPYYGASGVIDHIDDYLFDEPLVLVAEDGANLLLRSTPIAFIARGHYWVNNHAHVLRPLGGSARFWAYLLSSIDVSPLVSGSAQPKLTASALMNMRVAAPESVEEQRAIADYLDRETARIDTLIEEQQRLIEMLRERRSAAADSELGARVGSGKRLKWFVEEIDLRSSAVADNLPLMSVSIDWGVRRRDEVTTDDARADDLSNYKVCRKGDLVINRMRAFQGALGLAPEDGIVSPDYAVLRATSDLNSEWLACVMKTDRFVSEMASRIRGIGSAELGSARTPRINMRDMCEILLDVPVTGTQSEEAGAIRHLFRHTDTLIAETETFIELSRERRSALITAAVTGRIDVRDAA
jgi:type I restriction enzyme S subunit